MKSNDWRHKNVARYTPGNTKILYFLIVYLTGCTPIILICDFSRGGLNTRLYTLVSKPCSEATNKDYFIPRGLCFGCLCKLRIYFEKDLTGCTPFIFRSSSALQPHKSGLMSLFFITICFAKARRKRWFFISGI